MQQMNFEEIQEQLNLQEENVRNSIIERGILKQAIEHYNKNQQQIQLAQEIELYVNKLRNNNVVLFEPYPTLLTNNVYGIEVYRYNLLTNDMSYNRKGSFISGSIVGLSTSTREIKASLYYKIIEEIKPQLPIKLKPVYMCDDLENRCRPQPMTSTKTIHMSNDYYSAYVDVY
jgi:hypothetical protein